MNLNRRSGRARTDEFGSFYDAASGNNVFGGGEQGQGQPRSINSNFFGGGAQGQQRNNVSGGGGQGQHLSNNNSNFVGGGGQGEGQQRNKDLLIAGYEELLNRETAIMRDRRTSDLEKLQKLNKTKNHFLRAKRYMLPPINNDVLMRQFINGDDDLTVAGTAMHLG